MKPTQYFIELKNFFLSRQNRSRAVLFIILISLVILIIPAFIYERSLKGSLDSNRQKYKELAALSNDYIALRGKLETAEKKQSIKAGAGIANTVNDMFASLGIKSRIKSITGVSNRQLKGNISEEFAEIYIEKVTMNELVNIFYKIETMPVILSVKKTAIKKSFEKPELLDVTISLALFNLAPAAQP